MKGDEKNKGLKKITDWIEKQMKAVLGDKLGKVYKIRRRWDGDNPDGEFDSIFVFGSYSDGVDESMSQVTESAGYEFIAHCEDDDEDEPYVVFFKTAAEANDWIENREVQERYDKTNFKVIDGPRKMTAEEKAKANKGIVESLVTEASVKITQEMADEVRKAVETGVIPGVKKGIKQSGDTLVKSVLRAKFPEEYKAMTRQIGQPRIKQLGMFAHAVKDGDESKIGTTLKAIGLGGKAEDIAAKAAEKAADAASAIKDNAPSTEIDKLGPMMGARFG